MTGWDNFYRSFGLALLCWQHIENALFRVYFSVTGGSLLSAQVAFYSSDQFGAKLRLVHNAARVQLQGSDAAQWQALKADIEAAVKQRNALAHLGTVPYFTDDQEMHLALAPSMFVPGAMVRKRERIDTARCEEIGAEFRRLGRELVLFAMRPQIEPDGKTEN